MLLISLAFFAVFVANVVLGAAEVKFLAPSRVGDVLDATARVAGEKGKKRTVEVSVRQGDREVFAGTFTCFVLEQHVLGSDA